MKSEYDINSIVSRIATIVSLSVLLLFCAKARADTCNDYHVVKTGETLARIAIRNGTSVKGLLKLNQQIENKNLIKTGTKICLSDKKNSCGEYRAVRSGESLSLIALSLGMEPPYESAIKIANASGIKNPNRIEIGDKVCVDKNFIIGKKLEPIPEPVTAPVEIKEEIKEEIIVLEPMPVSSPGPEPKKEEPKKEDKETEKIEEKEVDPYVGIVIAPFLSYSRIDAEDATNGAKGAVLSKPDFGAEFKITQIWEDYFTSELITQIERKSYSTNSGRTFAEHGGQMLNFGIGMGIRPFKRLELKFRAFYGDEFYFRAPSMTSLAIDSTRTLKGDVAIYFDIVTSRYASTGFGGGGRLLKAAYVDAKDGTSYRTKNGYGYFGSFYMRHKFERVIFEESFSYESIKKDSDLFKQTHTAAYIKGSMSLLF